MFPSYVHQNITVVLIPRIVSGVVVSASVLVAVVSAVVSAAVSVVLAVVAVVAPSGSSSKKLASAFFAGPSHDKHWIQLEQKHTEIRTTMDDDNDDDHNTSSNNNNNSNVMIRGKTENSKNKHTLSIDRCHC